MDDLPLFAVANAVVAGGVAQVIMGPQFAREQWDVETITVTSLNAVITITQFGRVIDSTANDPRPTVTTDTAYHLGAGTSVTILWTGLANGTAVQATVVGKRRIGAGTRSAVQ